MLSNFKTKVIRDRIHLAFIRTLPCIYCSGESQACHLRTGLPKDHRGGTGLKPSDSYTIPMCHKCHALQHSTSEKLFHGGMDMVLKLANVLWLKTGNHKDCLDAIIRFRKNGQS